MASENSPTPEAALSTATNGSSTLRPCADCESFIDSRCPACGCCSHDWIEPVCACEAKGCGCRENREWDEAEAVRDDRADDIRTIR